MDFDRCTLLYHSQLWKMLLVLPTSHHPRLFLARATVSPFKIISVTVYLKLFTVLYCVSCKFSYFQSEIKSFPCFVFSQDNFRVFNPKKATGSFYYILCSGKSEPSHELKA